MGSKRRDFGQIVNGKKKGEYRVRWTENGRTLQKTIHGSKDLARRFLAKRQTVLSEQKAMGVRPVDRLRFEGLLAQYERIFAGQKSPASILREATYLRGKAAPFFRGMWLDEIQRSDVERFLTKRVTEDKIGTATRNRLLSYLSAFFKRAVALNHARQNPAAGIERKKEELRAVPFLDLDAQASLIDATPQPLRSLVALLLDSGLRLGEALRLEWRDVDFRRHMLAVRVSKSKRPREVPFTRRGREALEWAASQRSDDLPRVRDLVFPSLSRPSATGEPILKSAVRRKWVAACKRAGHPGLRLHDCRHTFATTAVRAGVSLGELRTLLGHSSLEMVLRYARHAPANAGDLARDRMEAFLEAGEKGHVRGHGSGA